MHELVSRSPITLSCQRIDLCWLRLPFGVFEGNVYRESVIEAGDLQHFHEAAGSEQPCSIYLYNHTQTSITMVRLSRESYLNLFCEEVYKLPRETTFLVSSMICTV